MGLFFEIFYGAILGWIGIEVYLMQKSLAKQTDLLKLYGQEILNIKKEIFIEKIPYLAPVTKTEIKIPKRSKERGGNKNPRTDEQRKRASEMAKARWAAKKASQATVS